MNYQIVEIINDSSENYRVRVILDENTTQFFHFKHEPSQEEVNSMVARFLEILSYHNDGV
jgi:uncharacterized protein (DUF1684 family)